MNRQVWVVVITVLAVTAGAGAFLATQQQRQKLGQPGVLVDDQPIYVAESGASTNPPALLTNRSRVYLPTNVLNFQSIQGPVASITVASLPQDTVFGHRLYGQSNGLFIDLQVVLMGADRSSIHKPQYCLVGSGYKWQGENLTTVRVHRPHAYDLPVNRLDLRRQVRDADGTLRHEAAVFVYWFVADGELTAQHKQRMWWMARDMLKTGVLQRWAYVICLAPCAPGTEDATFEGMKQFIADAVPQFHRSPGPPVEGVRAAAN
jgi:hypothetical protein